jgi:hypothetical protein
LNKIKKVSDMPWDDPDFVVVAEAIFRAGSRAGEENATAYEWGSIGRGQTWADFVKDAKAGYED